MTQLLNWLSMGGYCYYIWSAYGFVFVVSIIFFFNIKYQRRRIHRQLKEWLK